MLTRTIPLALCLLLTGCADPEITVPETMSVVALLPSHGSVGVGRGVQPLAYLSHVAASSTEVEEGFTLTCLGTAVADACDEPNALTCTGEGPEVAVVYDSTDQVARMLPVELLQADTCYRLTLAAGIGAVDENVGPLPIDVESEFRTQ